jgi:hypothetical protein
MRTGATPSIDTGRQPTQHEHRHVPLATPARASTLIRNRRAHHPMAIVA